MFIGAGTDDTVLWLIGIAGALLFWMLFFFATNDESVQKKNKK